MIKPLLDPKSDVSSMRAAMFIALFAAIIIAIIGLFKGSDLGGLGILCGVFVGAAFGGKSLSKFAEVKEREGGE